MTAYFIAQITVHDPERYKEYLAGFMPIFKRHDGRLRVTTAQEPTVIEGSWDLDRIVVLEFPNTEQAERWLNDPDYQALAQHRHHAAQTNMVLVNGFAG